MISIVIGQDRAERFSAWLDGILPENMTGDQAIRWLVYAIVFIVGFWVIPYSILKLLTKRADIVAAEWLKRVKYAGPFALIGYLFSFIKLPTKKERSRKLKHPCPHCGYDLELKMSYERLDFTHCPNCGGDIDPLYSIDDYIGFVSTALATDAEKVALGLVSMENFVEKDLMQRLVRAIITKAVRQRASDIRIEPHQDHVSVRYRIDGVMMEMVRLPASLGPAVVSAIKVEAQMDISEKRKPQDGGMQIMVDDADIDIRVASAPSQQGESVSMRVLDFRALEVDSSKLGMSKSTRRVFERAIREPHGLILVCGPTGSGKTTTLYVALRAIAIGDKNIISIEDPIEFRLDGVNQIQVNPAAGVTFATSLRSVLRQDPDVIMIGEVRDHETAEIAVNAAQTGHLVFSSLHTIDAAASVTRLFDLGLAPRQFADALSLVIAQRLIRLVCPDCKREAKANRDVLTEIGISPDGDLSEFQFVLGKGCPTCNDTGFLGRSGLFEFLVPNSNIRSALERGQVTTAELRALAVENGMRTLREEALVFLRQGMTTPEEVLRVTK